MIATPYGEYKYMHNPLLHTVVQTTMNLNYRVWGFGEAIGLRGLMRAGEVLQDTAPEAFVHGLMRAWLGRGVASTSEDHVGPGRELIEFWQRTGDVQFIEAAKKLADLHHHFPCNKSGARYHRPSHPGFRHQIWVDCMDNEPPFLVRLGIATGQENYIEQGVNELLAYSRLLQNENSGLYKHGYEQDCGSNGEYWARGNGWALMGLVDVLLNLPSSHPRRAEILQRFQALCDGLALAQLTSGLWRTVIDRDTYEESTLAAMVAHALMEADSAGLIQDKRHGKMALRAYAALPPLIDTNGALHLVSDATPVGQCEMYATRPFGTFAWGQGPLLLALTSGETLKMQEEKNS